VREEARRERKGGDTHTHRERESDPMHELRVIGWMNCMYGVVCVCVCVCVCTVSQIGAGVRRHQEERVTSVGWRAWVTTDQTQRG